MGKFTAFKVPLKSLSEGVHEFEYRLDKAFFANMENTDIRDAEIDVRLKLEHKAGIYDLDFVIEGDLTLLCDRCLDDLHLPVATSYHIAVKYGDDYDDSSDDLLVIPQSDNYLNVAYMLYDTVALTIPLKHVHPAGKCNRQMSAILRKHSASDADENLEEELIEEIDDMDNASQSAGSSAAQDPRWDALRDIRTED